MITHPEELTAGRRKVSGSRSDLANAPMLYKSDDLNVSALTAGLVHVDISIAADPSDLDRLRAIFDSGAAPIVPGIKAGKIGKKAPAAVREAMVAAFEALFSRRFTNEIDKIVDAYRAMLHENLAKGDDLELQKALNRARLQEKILAGTMMVDQPQACELLGLSGANPSATMKRREEKQELLRFTVDGRAAYPLFQFDIEGRQIFPVLARLIALRPQSWSDFRLLHWLTRPHLDFGTPPCERLGRDDDEIVAALKREIVPPVHG